jgi:prepilin-type N-terminal cleavage/methylation domain-containing protein
MNESGAERFPPERGGFVTMTRNRRQRGFTLVEILVVLAIIGILVGLVLPAVQKVRDASARTACRNNLKQIGLALMNFTGDYGYLPPGMVTELSIQDSYHTAFTYLLPYLEQDAVYNQYEFDAQWYDPSNYAPVAQQPKVFFCPANRANGQMNLAPFIQQWGAAMPPLVGSCDYILCKGANAGLYFDPTLIPPQARGLFNVTQADFGAGAGGRPTPRFLVRAENISDGLSNTLAIGEGAGGNVRYLVGDINNPGQPAIQPFLNGPAVMEQAWAAASLGDASHPWTTGIFGVTAQFGLPPNTLDEPMNRQPGSPTIVSNDTSGFNLSGKDRVSGFRSMHLIGCQFLFADGSVHLLPQSIDPAVYRAFSTYSGGEIVASPEN